MLRNRGHARVTADYGAMLLGQCFNGVVTRFTRQYFKAIIISKCYKMDDKHVMEMLQNGQCYVK